MVLQKGTQRLFAKVEKNVPVQENGVREKTEPAESRFVILENKIRTEINLKDVLLTYISWNDYDEIADFIKNKANDKAERAEKLKDYFVVMRVRRNFKSEKDYPETMENVIDVLDDSNDLVNETVDSLNGKLQRFYSGNTKNCYVACSKILWLYNHDNIIMDSINQKMLKQLVGGKAYNNDYGAFLKDWKVEFSKGKNLIQTLTDTFKKNVRSRRIRN